MAFFEGTQQISLVAGGTIGQYHAVSVNSSGQAVVAPLAGTSASIIGICQQAAVSGDTVTIVVGGVSKAKCSGTVTAGNAVCVATVDGQIANFTGATNRLGVALQTGAANEIVAILVNGAHAVGTGT